MKALTLTQPWASLVVAGVKRIETRSWSSRLTDIDLAIHAAAGWSAADRDFALDLMDAGVLPERRIYTTRSIKPDLPLGCVLGTVRLHRCVPTRYLTANGTFADSTGVWNLTPQEREYGDYSPGRYGWLLTYPTSLPRPVPARGALGLWDWERSE